MSFTDLKSIIQLSITNDMHAKDHWICKDCWFCYDNKPNICSKYLYKLSDKKIMQYMMDEYWIVGFEDFLECRQIIKKIINCIFMKKSNK